MISRPTTQQLILDCCHDLMTQTLPQLTDGPAQVHLHMLVGVLQNAAVRSAHEIAWMRDEAAKMRAYAGSVVEAQGADPAITEALAATPERPDSLHLDDVVEDYGLASTAFAAALDKAMTAGEPDLTRRAVELLDARVVNEREVMAGWGATGR